MALDEAMIAFRGRSVLKVRCVARHLPTLSRSLCPSYAALHEEQARQVRLHDVQGG